MKDINEVRLEVNDYFGAINFDKKVSFMQEDYPALVLKFKTKDDFIRFSDFIIDLKNKIIKEDDSNGAN
jgi:hypothetical protein